jgi:hypothetical protein
VLKLRDSMYLETPAPHATAKNVTRRSKGPAFVDVLKAFSPAMRCAIDVWSFSSFQRHALAVCMKKSGLTPLVFAPVLRVRREVAAGNHSSNKLFVSIIGVFAVSHTFPWRAGTTRPRALHLSETASRWELAFDTVICLTAVSA